MVLATSQEHFDEVVKENIQEFEMTVQEAIDEAVQQLESQGCNLAMIIKDANMYKENGDKIVHPVVAALNALSEETGDTETYYKNLKIIQDECDIDLARRCFVSKSGAYPTLLKCLKESCEKKDQLVPILTTFCSLCNGQPDLLDEEGVQVMTMLLKEQSDDPEIAAQMVKLIRLNCTKHEVNRKMFVKAGLIKNLVNVLEINKSSADVVKQVSNGLQVLTLDDDIRVPFGSAHENAKQIVHEGGALKCLLDICKDYTDNVGVQGELFNTLSKLMVRSEFCKEVMDLGGLELIIRSFQEHITNQAIVKQAVGLLKALAGNDDLKLAVVAAGGVQLILAAMTQHQGNAQIASLGCLAISAIMLRTPENCSVVVENNGHHVILQAMKVHSTNEYVMKNACMAIRNVVARSREYCDLFLELGAEELVNLAQQVAECEDEAKAALRDLGCHVELKERWTGQKGGLARDVY